MGIVLVHTADPHPEDPEVLGPLDPLVPQELQIFLPVAALYQHRLCLYRFQHASIREARQTRAVAVDVFFPGHSNSQLLPFSTGLAAKQWVVNHSRF
jgi:hypothetical protein